MKSFRTYLTICSALSMVFLSTVPAEAHTTLVSSVPANDSLVSFWPKEITLKFAEPLAKISGASLNQVSVTNALAEDIGGAVTVKGDLLSIATKENTASGPVLVSFRVAASDGHVVEGEYAFTFQGAGATPSASPITSASHSHNSNSSTIIKASTGLVVLALIVGIFAYRRKL